MTTPTRPGSRLESAWLLLQLLGDLLSTPFHLVVFLSRRSAHRRRFLASLGRADTRQAGGRSEEPRELSA